MGWEKLVRFVTPYTPGEQPKEAGIVKLNTNENPYPPSPAVAKALAAFDADTLRRYSDPTAQDLVRAISKSYDVPEDQIFVGVGSDDVLAMAFQTFFNGEAPVLFPDITYSFYDVWADAFGIPYRQIPLEEDFSVDCGKYIGAEAGGIVLANPNAPTGLALPLDELERVVRAHQDCVVIIDEAYVDFGGQSALPLAMRYENVLVVQTTSKSRSFAGGRIGFAFGNKQLIKYLNDFKFSFNSYTMGSVSIAAGAALFSDEAYYRETAEKVIRTREAAKERLAELGFSFPDSKTNFIFAKHKNVPGAELFEKLKERKIFVRHFQGKRISDYLRITIGTEDEMERLFVALGEIL